MNATFRSRGATVTHTLARWRVGAISVVLVAGSLLAIPVAIAEEHQIHASTAAREGDEFSVSIKWSRRVSVVLKTWLPMVPYRPGGSVTFGLELRGLARVLETDEAGGIRRCAITVDHLTWRDDEENIVSDKDTKRLIVVRDGDATRIADSSFGISAPLDEVLCDVLELLLGGATPTKRYGLEKERQVGETWGVQVDDTFLKDLLQDDFLDDIVKQPPKRRVLTGEIELFSKNLFFGEQCLQLRSDVRAKYSFGGCPLILDGRRHVTSASVSEELLMLVPVDRGSTFVRVDRKRTQRIEIEDVSPDQDLKGLSVQRYVERVELARTPRGRKRGTAAIGEKEGEHQER